MPACRPDLFDLGPRLSPARSLVREHDKKQVQLLDVALQPSLRIYSHAQGHSMVEEQGAASSKADIKFD